jgi:hypothetical protein
MFARYMISIECFILILSYLIFPSIKYDLDHQMNLVQARQKSSTFNQLQVCYSVNDLPYIYLS